MCLSILDGQQKLRYFPSLEQQQSRPGQLPVEVDVLDSDASSHRVV
jgi:hypothetical protein